MKFVTALLLAAATFVGINAKCVEEANEEFFLLPATSKAKAEERCIENGGILAEINDRNQNNAASAVAACTEVESGSADVWIKSWNTDSYNNVGILMNVNKENKGFTIHQYFENFSRKRDEIFAVEDDAEPVAAPTVTEAVEEPTAAPTEPAPEVPAPEEPAPEEPAPEEPVVEPPVVEPPVVEPPVVEPAPEQSAEEPVDEPVFVDDGVGTKYEVLCQVA